MRPALTTLNQPATTTLTRVSHSGPWFPGVRALRQRFTPPGGKPQIPTVTLKANGYLQVDFNCP